MKNNLSKLQSEAKLEIDNKFYNCKNGGGIRTLDLTASHYISVDEVKQVVSDQIEKAVEETTKETVDKAFEWIWNGWNLDLGNLDRAKEHFLSLKQGDDNE